MTDRERKGDPDELIVSSNGLGNISSMPIPGDAADLTESGISNDEHDSESAEDDDGLLHGRSPEFEHLVKPVHKEAPNK